MIGPEAFKGTLLTHCNGITTFWKRFGRVSRDNTKARELILDEDLAKNVSLSLHNSFCLNRESKVKGLPNQAKRLQEQREWMRAYEQLKAWKAIVTSSDDCVECVRTQYLEDKGHELKRVFTDWFLSRERAKEKGARGHGK